MEQSFLCKLKEELQRAEASKLFFFSRSNASRSKFLELSKFGLRRSRKCIYYKNALKVVRSKFAPKLFFHELMSSTVNFEPWQRPSLKY